MAKLSLVFKFTAPLKVFNLRNLSIHINIFRASWSLESYGNYFAFIIIGIHRNFLTAVRKGIGNYRYTSVQKLSAQWNSKFITIEAQRSRNDIHFYYFITWMYLEFSNYICIWNKLFDNIVFNNELRNKGNFFQKYF